MKTKLQSRTRSLLSVAGLIAVLLPVAVASAGSMRHRAFRSPTCPDGEVPGSGQKTIWWCSDTNACGPLSIDNKKWKSCYFTCCYPEAGGPPTRVLSYTCYAWHDDGCCNGGVVNPPDMMDVANCPNP